MVNNNPLETLLAFTICIVTGVLGTLGVQMYKKHLVKKV